MRQRLRKKRPERLEQWLSPGIGLSGVLHMMGD
jgi:hypothetical protein